MVRPRSVSLLETVSVENTRICEASDHWVSRVEIQACSLMTTARAIYSLKT